MYLSADKARIRAAQLAVKAQQDIELALMTLKKLINERERENNVKTKDELILEKAKKAALAKTGADIPKPPHDFVITQGAWSVDSSSVELESFVIRKQKRIGELVKGKKVIKRERPKPRKPTEVQPLLFNVAHSRATGLFSDTSQREVEEVPPMDPSLRKGVLRFALSDRSFIDKGWTMLPTEKVVRKMNIYRMRPAYPELNWFEHNKNKGIMLYDTGERLAEVDENGRGNWYYKNGQLALTYYDSKEAHNEQRVVIYSSGDPDERGKRQPITLLAMFDYLGSGVVFDHAGKIRVKYNQTEGVVLDRDIGPYSRWKWHTLNDPPVLRQVMIDTKLAHPDPKIISLGLEENDGKTRADDEDMIAIEQDNFIRDKTKKLSQKFQPFPIRIKVLKINDQFSLKILDQSHVNLHFKNGSANLKLNLGMILDNQEIIDTRTTTDIADVMNSLEQYPPRSDSLQELQNNLANSRRNELIRMEHAERVRLKLPESSADRLIKHASKPPRALVLPRSTSSGTSTCNPGLRKPPQAKLYYDTSL